MTKIEAIYEREKQEAVDAAIKENTQQVTYNLIFDLVNSGSLSMEDGKKKIGLNDKDFEAGLEEYRNLHKI